MLTSTNLRTLFTRRKALFCLAATGATVLPCPRQILAQDTAGVRTPDEQETQKLPIDAINAELSPAQGTQESDGVLLFDLTRSDLSTSLSGTAVDSGIGFDTEIGFQPYRKGAFVKWEFCLRDEEVTPVLDALLASGLAPASNAFTALHNHFIEAEPKVKFMHGSAVGDPVLIARTLRNVLEKSAQPFELSTPKDTQLPNDQITSIIGGDSTISGAILTVTVQRKETFSEYGIRVRRSNLVDSVFNFESLGQGQAAVTAEITVLPEEAGPVAGVLRQHGIAISALHNHELVIRPRLYYMHGFGTNDPITLAHSIRDALNHTNSQFKS